MLEKITFNYDSFRYREEGENMGIVYNLRYGNFLIVKGKTKEHFDEIINSDGIYLDINNDAINYLINCGVFLINMEEDK